jgi:ABC-type enterobactin transport system permease subunit
MPPFLHRATHVAAILPAVLATVAGPVQAHELPAPHLIHAYEGWVALAVVVLALTGAGLLIRRALRR